ncbi:MAG: thioredoxin family protein [Candidatus Brocadiia bacterium]|nr:MAG: thioredoxin family protein [Candidatus Brocadiia bacterium]
MMENDSDIQGNSNPGQNEVTSYTEKKGSMPVWKLFLVFMGIVILVLIRQDREPINWIEDYQQGVELAKKENKPVLLAFHKRGDNMSNATINDTYNNPKVKQFIRKNFIPIKIDIDNHPELVKKYNVGYSVVHIVQKPSSDEFFGPRLGYDPPALFINKMTELLQKAGLPVK